MKALISIRRVQGTSMAPTYVPGKIVLTIRPWRPLVTGDVIVFGHDSIEKIKRIKSIDAHGLYVEGDNVAASTDSRDFGYIKRQSVVGIVVWPKRYL